MSRCFPSDWTFDDFCDCQVGCSWRVSHWRERLPLRKSTLARGPRGFPNHLSLKYLDPKKCKPQSQTMNDNGTSRIVQRGGIEMNWRTSCLLRGRSEETSSSLSLCNHHASPSHSNCWWLECCQDSNWRTTSALVVVGLHTFLAKRLVLKHIV